MVTINLCENAVEDFKAIRELQKMGFTDEQIQRWYDNSRKTEKGGDE
jgi:hypothetical protein